MTQERLEFIAKQTAAMGKTEIRVRKQLHGILAVYYEGEGLQRLRRFERYVEARFGADWLNKPQVKEIVFGAVSAANTLAPSAAAKGPPDAIVVCTAINDFEMTAAFQSLPDADQARIWDEGSARSYPQYFEPHDALMAIAQTPELVCVFRQRLQGGLLIGEPVVNTGPQEALENSRLKMYGRQHSPELLDFIERFRAGGGLH